MADFRNILDSVYAPLSPQKTFHYRKTSFNLHINYTRPIPFYSEEDDEERTEIEYPFICEDLFFLIKDREVCYSISVMGGLKKCEGFYSRHFERDGKIRKTIFNILKKEGLHFFAYFVDKSRYKELNIKTQDILDHLVHFPSTLLFLHDSLKKNPEVVSFVAKNCPAFFKSYGCFEFDIKNMVDTIISNPNLLLYLPQNVLANLNTDELLEKSNIMFSYLNNLNLLSQEQIKSFLEKNPLDYWKLTPDQLPEGFVLPF